MFAIMSGFVANWSQCLRFRFSNKTKTNISKVEKQIFIAIQVQSTIFIILNVTTCQKFLLN